LFGRFYMAAIDHVHRSYITPAMLRMAVEYATNSATTHEQVTVAALPTN
jgi:hypothetical protein